MESDLFDLYSFRIMLRLYICVLLLFGYTHIFGVVCFLQIFKNQTEPSACIYM